MIKIGNTGIVGVYKGSTPITSIYKGIDKVFGSTEENPHSLVCEFKTTAAPQGVWLPMFPYMTSYGKPANFYGTIDWGDGTTTNVSEEGVTYRPEYYHEYSTAGTYIARFTPTSGYYTVTFDMYNNTNPYLKKILQAGDSCKGFTTSNYHTNPNTYDHDIYIDEIHLEEAFSYVHLYNVVGLYDFNMQPTLATQLSLHYKQVVPELNVHTLSAKSLTISKAQKIVGQIYINYNIISLVGVKEFEFIHFNNSISSGIHVNNLNDLITGTFHNIGGPSSTTYDFSTAKNWGTGGDKSRQSVIDSLITYSVPKNITIQLSQNTYNLLTEDELNQMITKGYTITV